MRERSDDDDDEGNDDDNERKAWEMRKEKGVGGVIIMMSKRQGSFYFQGCMLSCLVFALFSLHSLIFPPNHKKITLPHFSLFIQTPFSALDLGNLQSLNDMKPCL